MSAGSDDADNKRSFVPEDQGLPGDQDLIDFITSQPSPPKVKDVAREFGIRADGRARLRQRLRQLAESGKIDRLEGRRLGSPDNLPPVTVLEITRITDDGDAIAEPVEPAIDPMPVIVIMAERKKGRSVAIGDRVLARLTRIDASTYDGKVIRRLDRHRSRLFGHVFKNSKGYGLEPVERQGKSSFQLLPPDARIIFSAGDLVEAEITRSTGYGPKTARVIRTLGPADQSGAFSTLAIAEFELRHVFPEPALAEADAARKPLLENRVDLRNTPLITIDGADAKDFDDAVHAVPADNGGWRLTVAIADVAHYVAPGSALDREAQTRGNSVYLPDMVIPMLPEALSNGLCSLVPGEDRACLAVEMIIDEKGVLKEHRFFRGLMRSHARLTYDWLEEYRTGMDTDPPAGLSSICLDHLFGAYEVLARQRKERGALEIDLPEKKIIFDHEGKATGVSRRHQSISQKLIEEFMILANVAAAETLEKAKALCVYRAHEPPDPAKVDGLRDTAKAMGLSFAKGQVIRPQIFNTLLGKARERGDEAGLALLNETVLRCQSQAEYRITNPGHFGLALRRYAHFTSPIRRYADLMVHRSLIHLTEQGKPASTPGPEEAEMIASGISETERRAAAAERRTTDRFAAQLMMDQRGRIITGRVTSVTGFGAFVTLEPHGSEGLLPFSRLPDDYYETDPVRGVIQGQRSGLTIRTGQDVDVLIEEVMPLKATVTLAWAEGGMGGTPGKGFKGRKNKPAGRKSRDMKKRGKRRR